MEAEPSEGAKSPCNVSCKTVLVLFALAMLMVWSIFFTGPSGQSLGFYGFIQFWLRELIILALAVVALLIKGINWLSQRSQKNQGTTHAP